MSFIIQLLKSIVLISAVISVGFFVTNIADRYNTGTRIDTELFPHTSLAASTTEKSAVAATTSLQKAATTTTDTIPKTVPATKKTTTVKKIATPTQHVSTPGALAVSRSTVVLPPLIPAATSTISESSSTVGSASDMGSPSNEGALNQQDILTIVNKERATAGLPALTYNKQLSAIAEIKAVDMINKQYFAHVSPDGTDIVGLAKRYGYQYLNIGENLAMGDFVSSAEVMDGWMHSPGHRANILNKNYTEVGISAVEGNYQGHYVWFAVQEFGRPLSLCPPVDQSLEVTINGEEATLSQDEKQLAVYRSELDAGSLDRDTYNSIVAQYNALVENYNQLAEKTKQDIASYNVGVNAFNSCIAS